MNKRWFGQKAANINPGQTNFFFPKGLSIRARILLLVLVALIMMGLLNILFITRTLQYNRQYDAILGNITMANNLSAYSKETIDAEMWNIVAGKTIFAEGQQYQTIAEVNRQISQLVAAADSDRGRLKLEVVRRTVSTLTDQVDLMGQQIEQGVGAGANEVLLEKIRGTTTLIQSLLADYMLFEVERSGQQYDLIQSNYTRWIFINLLVMGLIVVFSIGAAWFISAGIYTPIKKLHNDITTIIQQDLETPVIYQNMDEISGLEANFNILATQLREKFTLLEDQVRKRTSELALSMEVGQRASTIRDLNLLLPAVTEFIWDQFSLYYVQVFLIDDIGQNLVLRAGTGLVGQQLLAQGHTISIAEYVSIVERTKESLAYGHLSRMPAGYYSSIVGHVAVEREPVVVPDTSQSRFFKPDPMLPETRSQLAIPLVVEDRVMGVLDMQDNKVNTFTPENLTVFEAMAVQLAISIDSARQWAIAQEAQQKAESALQQFTREAWTDKLASSQGSEGFVYDLSKVMPLLNTAALPDHTTAVSLMVQDQAIGQLMVNNARANLTPDEQALLQSVAQQLAQKAENLRLYEATQQRASREQIARQIIDKVRASRNIEMALRTATEELNRALGTARAVVDLHVPQTDFVKTSAFDKNIIPDEKQSGNGKPIKDTPPDVPSEFTDHLVSEDRDDDLRLE